MSFSVAEGYVELSAKGASGVMGMVDRVTGKVRDLSHLPMDALGEKIGGLKSHFAAMLNPVGMLTAALEALGAGAGIAEFISKGMELEETKTNFDQLTRSAAATDEILGAMKAQFSGTSIDSEQYKAAAREMLAMGTAASEIPGRLQSLGNIAAATGDSLQGMASAMRRAEITGKVTTRTLMMMPAAVEELNRMYPELGGNVMEAAEAGRIGLAHLQAAVNNLGGSSGKFGNAMKAQQEGMMGQWKIAKDKLGQTFGTIGTALIEGFHLPAVMGKISEWLSWFNATYGDRLKEVFESIGSTVTTAWNTIAGAAGKAWNWVSDMAQAVEQSTAFQAVPARLGDRWDYISSAVVGAWDWVADAAVAVWHSKTLAAYLDGVCSLFGLMQDVQTAVWEILVSGATAAWNLLKDLGAKINDCVGWFFGMGKSGQTTFDDLGAGVYKFITDAIESIRVMVRNWDISLALIWEYLKLGFFNAVEIVRNFGHNAASIVGWLGKDLGATFTTMVNFVTTIFTNLGKNIMAVWTAVLEFIHGKGFHPDFTPMLDGFKSTMSKMPEMTSAATQQSNAAIEGLIGEMGQRETKRAMDQAKAKHDAEVERQRRRRTDGQIWRGRASGVRQENLRLEEAQPGGAGQADQGRPGAGCAGAGSLKEGKERCWV